MAEKPTHEELEQRIQELEQVEYELKQEKQQKALSIIILDTINKSETWKDCIEKILGEIKQFTGFEAIAIRLREGEDFPYYVTKGFPAHFVEAERYLCTRDHKGEIERDSEGNPYIECMCGNVICGRTDTSKDFFTEGGSFWSNNTSKLLSETTDEDRQTRTRNRCNSEGYESVALFPLKAGHEILGLLQLNDMRTHQFTDDTIRFFEDIGISIGTAFSRKLIKNMLQESEEKFKAIFNNSTDGIIVADPETKNFIFANPSICETLGYTEEELTQMGVFDIHPKDSLEHAVSEYEAQAKGEKLLALNIPFLKKDGTIIYIDTASSTVKIGRKLTLMGIFRDATDRKRMEEELQKAHNKLEQRIEERTAELLKANKQLKESQQNLQIKASDLAELNAALNILLDKREKDKEVLEEGILTNVRTLIEPYLTKLKKSKLPQSQKTLLDILESNLNEIVSTFTRKLSSKYLNLSPSEIQVANLVKHGKSNKEIAEIYNVSKRTIAFHRENIRKKLGLTNKKTNLKTYLMSIG